MQITLRQSVAGRRLPGRAVDQRARFAERRSRWCRARGIRRASRARLLAFSAVLTATLAPLSASAAGPSDFLVDQLSITQFRWTIEDLALLNTRYWARVGNTRAVNMIKAKLESYGYTNVTLDPYVYQGSTEHSIYATKMGAVDPTSMYIVSAHMDSINFGALGDAPGADDDASGTALVLELARVLAKARTDVSVRFILWNNEETGLDGSTAYVDAHRALQGTLSEPTWLGIIQHDMILFDHLASPDADVEYQADHDFGGQAIVLANAVADAMSQYGTMPAEVGDNMDFTDSVPFWDDTAAVSVRENQRVAEIGEGSNPHWHESTDRPETYTDADYEFGFNIVKMTTGAIGELVNAVPDCDGDGVSDVDQIAGGAADVNADGILDDCQDCDGNGTLDPTELANGTAFDCNGNGTLDRCDVVDGFSADADGDDVPDECDLNTPDEGIVPHNRPKNRYATFVPTNEQIMAVQVALAGGPVLGWVEAPDEQGIARISDSRVDRPWTEPVVHVGDCGIVPVEEYEFRSLRQGIDDPVSSALSPPLAVSTIAKPLQAEWADCVGPFSFVCTGSYQCCDPNPDCPGAVCPDGEVCEEQWAPPEGATNFGDVQAAIRKFQEVGVTAHITWVDLHGAEGAAQDPFFDPPNGIINFSDVQQIIKGFQGEAYPYSSPTGCP